MTRILLILITGLLIFNFIMIGISYTVDIRKPPIKVKSVQGFNVPDIMFDLNKWQKLENEMDRSKAEVLVLNWQGDGGEYDDILMGFIVHLNNLKNKGKKILFNLVGDSYSAHAYAVCYGDAVIGNDKYFLMFHPMESVDASTGKMIGIVKDKIAIDNYRAVLQPCVDKGLITREELEKAMTRDEVYIIGSPNGTHTSLIVKDPRQ